MLGLANPARDTSQPAALLGGQLKSPSGFGGSATPTQASPTTDLPAPNPHAVNLPAGSGGRGLCGPLPPVPAGVTVAPAVVEHPPNHALVPVEGPPNHAIVPLAPPGPPAAVHPEPPVCPPLVALRPPPTMPPGAFI